MLTRLLYSSGIAGEFKDQDFKHAGQMSGILPAIFQGMREKSKEALKLLNNGLLMVDDEQGRSALAAMMDDYLSTPFKVLEKKRMDYEM